MDAMESAKLGEDLEKKVDKKENLRHCAKACGIVLIYLVLITILGVIIYFAVFKDDEPKVRQEEESLLQKIERDCENAGFVRDPNIDGSAINITFSVVNLITEDERTFVLCLHIETSLKPLVEIMNVSASYDDRYSYTGTEYAGLGLFIDSINGLLSDAANEMSWVFLSKLGEDSLCVIPLGVSSYVPHDGEMVIALYEKWDIYDRLPRCVNPREESTILCNKQTTDQLTCPVDKMIVVNSAQAGQYSEPCYSDHCCPVMPDQCVEDLKHTPQHAMEFDRIADACDFRQTCEITFSPMDMISCPSSPSDFTVVNHECHSVDHACTEAAFVRDPNITGPSINVTFTIGNLITFDNTTFAACMHIETSEETLLGIMNVAAPADQRFRFTGVEWAGMGLFVKSFNGVYDDVPMERSWAFLRREESTGEMCTIPLGVRSYMPRDGEHIFALLQYWSLYDRVPRCGNHPGVNTTMACDTHINTQLTCPEGTEIDIYSAQIGRYYSPCNGTECCEATRMDCLEDVEHTVEHASVWEALTLLCNGERSCDISHTPTQMLSCGTAMTDYTVVNYVCEPEA